MVCKLLKKHLVIMQNKLHYNTITPLLLSILRSCMSAIEFDSFRLVGGTSLSLQLGHRISVDIDLFTDAPYESVDFKAIDKWLRANYTYVDAHDFEAVGMGKPYFVGENKNNCIKLDLYYTDSFIDDYFEVDGIRLATIEEIIAMKADVIMRGGRKKDFWDLHELMDKYTLDNVIHLHKKRYPYNHEPELLINKLTDFKFADDDFEPQCLRGKHWEIIKMDIIEFAGM